MKSSHAFHHFSSWRHGMIVLLMGSMIACCGTTLAQTENATIRVTGMIGGGSCAISTQPVNLGSHNTGEFTGIGTSPPSGWVNFPITSQGCSSDIVTVRMGFDGTADPANNGVFAIRPGGAQGIGIELQKEDGTATVIPNSTTNLLDWVPVATGSVYPMRARYVQTLGTVTPGAANSVVVVMLSYL